MIEKTEEIRITEIPQELFEEIKGKLSHYEVGFVRIRENESFEDANLIGSGTLVESDGVYGILTANHVIEALPETGVIGLILSSVLFPAEHRYILRVVHLKMVPVGRRPTSCESEGPDLGVVVLPSTYLGTIKARKSFYNLSLMRDEILTTPLANNIGIWFLCGSPSELTTEEDPSVGFGRVKGFCGFYGAGGAPRGYISGKYDYLEIDIDYKIDELPQSFGGVSGGGLWQVPIQRSAEGKLHATEPILSGVAFYQSSMANHTRSIKCHGRKSIYKVMYDLMEKECSYP